MRNSRFFCNFSSASGEAEIYWKSFGIIFFCFHSFVFPHSWYRSEGMRNIDMEQQQRGIWTSADNKRRIKTQSNQELSNSGSWLERLKIEFSIFSSSRMRFSVSMLPSSTFWWIRNWIFQSIFSFENWKLWIFTPDIYSESWKSFEQKKS